MLVRKAVSDDFLRLPVSSKRVPVMPSHWSFDLMIGEAEDCGSGGLARRGLPEAPWSKEGQ